jgi:molybdate transport system ATP-binding protein
MTCHIAGQDDAAGIELEVPLAAMQPRMEVRVGVRAGDILLATVLPQGLSARNVLRGRILSLVQRDVTVIARVDCGVVLEVHLTPAARESLALAAEREVWLVIKTYSCHLLR